MVPVIPLTSLLLKLGICGSLSLSILRNRQLIPAYHILAVDLRTFIPNKNLSTPTRLITS